MPTNYPDDFDLFNEPSIPEETVLSSAGTGSRNHPEHHRDLGDAVEALQHHSAQLTHDHGGGSGKFDTSKLPQAHTHESADTDSGAAALHHTLGSEAGQAAAGDHRHDYNGPSIFNQPLLLCTSTTRPPPHPGLHIYETDTNVWRVWGTFDAAATYEGLNSTDPFTGTFANGMDPALWDLEITSGDLAHGHPATGAGLLSWVDGGTVPNRAIARRIKAEDKETETDDQVITWKTGATATEVAFFNSEFASDDIYFRMSADKQSYIRARVGAGFVKFFYTITGKANEKSLGALDNIATYTPSASWTGQLVDRTLSLYCSGAFIGTVVDTKNLTAKGAANRGWGCGQVAGNSFFGAQTTPMELDSIRIEDYHFHYATNRWTVLPVAAIPICRLRQSKKQQLYAAGSIIEWADELEDNFDYFNINTNSTDIRIREPGLYLIEAAIQWDPQYVPDIAHVVSCINGVETTVRNQQFMRGNLFTPGFSQTLQLAGKLRFAENDVLTLKASYTAGPGLLNLIFSWFDLPSKINSRIDVTYLNP